MKRLAGFLIVVLLVALPALAKKHRFGAGSDDSPAAEDTPSPSPSAHHTHKHAHASPSPTASDEDDTPAPKKKHHHHTADTEEASPSPSPDYADATPTPSSHGNYAADASLDPDQLEGFDRQPDDVKTLIKSALDLTRRNLTYTFSSADPANGGMDCSGFVYYVLKQNGFGEVPRQANEQYVWIRKAGKFRAVLSHSPDSFELDELKPGDLMFWTGTYVTDRDPPVTHTMIYLGKEKETGKRVMVGSSDGRSYDGAQRWGVSVFDFKPTRSPEQGKSSAQFVGYGSIPDR